ncbi:hypothetical protein STAQ_38320 [Allostella sp. ATCC 35155]|nr:hypothetical protein STAQ_38320 [Stella sp. ATCC 35155]
MKRRLIGSAIATAILASAGAGMAQTVTTTTTTRSTTLAPEQRTVVQEYVVQQRRPSVTVENYEVRPGTVLPPTVQFYAVPQVDQYRYSVVNNRQVIVDPQTRQVIEILN